MIKNVYDCALFRRLQLLLVVVLQFLIVLLVVVLSGWLLTISYSRMKQGV